MAGAEKRKNRQQHRRRQKRQSIRDADERIPKASLERTSIGEEARNPKSKNAIENYVGKANKPPEKPPKGPLRKAQTPEENQEKILGGP